MRTGNNLIQNLYLKSLSVVLGSLLSLSATAETLPGFSVQKLFPIHTDPQVRDININGLTAGNSLDYDYRATLWDVDGTPFKLDTSDITGNSTAMAMNDLGDVVGYAGGGNAQYYQNRVRVPLELASSAVPYDINNHGVIVGDHHKIVFGEVRAVIWRDQKLSLLGGEPTETSSQARAINNLDTVAGAFLDVNGKYPVLWKNDQVIRLGKLPGFEQQAETFALNDSEQVVGSSSINNADDSLSSRAVIWQQGLIASLPTLGGSSATATDINNQGQIVGSSTTASGETHPFLWQNGLLYDMSSVFAPFCDPAAVSCETIIEGINDLGQIAVTITQRTTYTIHFAYKLTIDDPVIALAQLPAIDAPLNFVTPIGAQPVKDIVFPVDADLSLSMRSSDYTVAIGSQYTFLVSVLNNGPAKALDVETLISLPKNFELISTTGTDCTGAQTLTCLFPEISPSASGVVSVAVKAIRGGGSVKTKASVSSTTPDPDLSNNTASLSAKLSR